ncbi:hypothetical protein AAA799E16_00476 [Marine Group I thaumarchaeote SCGC AAA799-E16]|uniref:Uncharacterized protein n=2 Tax=Marine Group I TaxID=905826 RepID=A0A087RMG4_9ARCH|nr:hypothetical protein AAA799E16_00476 [Marine Group I thaumarchaeote SCGC AAA799-E16]KFM14668.1 hypothetical protein AAA799D11_01674 [Marine Group I thaumarchaeote SCGC AAA799-D11]
MNSSKKGGLVILFILGMSIFGYSQYASASQIGVSITQSELLSENEKGAEYNIELQFENPSLLILTSGTTEFFVIADEQMVGKGQLEPFTLQPLDSSYVKGTFHTDSDNDEAQSVKITGVTKYDAIFTSIEIPFVYYPTEEQAREFIHQG